MGNKKGCKNFQNLLQEMLPENPKNAPKNGVRKSKNDG